MPNQFNSPEGDLENYFVSEYWLIDQYIGDQLWGWGAAAIGRLGQNQVTPATATSPSTPVTTSAGGTNWKQVSGGNTATAAIKTDGTLWTWGNNANGQLGVNSDIISRSTPVTTFVGGTNWKSVSTGGYAMAAIKTDGTLWSWGSGAQGELGNIITTAANRCTPVTTFLGGTNWKQVSAGSRYTAAIKTDGTLWLWGMNAGGQLGINLLGATANRCTPVTTFLGGTNWKQVSCGMLGTTAGTCTTAAIKTDGTLWMWGFNNNGQCGTNITGNAICTPVTTFLGGTNWKQVSSGGYITSAIKTDGTLWTWGFNGSSGLGINLSGATFRCTPVTTFVGGTNWKSVSSGGGFSAAIKTDGSLWVWGGNAIGEMGNLSSRQACTPVTTFAGGTNWKQLECGWNHTMAITSGSDPNFFVS